MSLIINIFESCIRIMAPYMFGAMGALYSVKSGVTNIAIEGMMLTGAFAGFWGAVVSGSPWIGVLTALIAGAAVGLLLAFLSVTVGTNQVVAGTAINLGALGLTSFLYTLLYGNTSIIMAQKLPNAEIPFLSKIPVLGTALFSNSILTYFCLLLIPVSWWYFKKTSWGLNIRAVGENPSAADSLGVPVVRIRYLSVIVSGAICALGGAYLTLELSSVFTENISSGKGYIALAALILGRREPVGVLLASFLFAFTEAFQIRMQTYQIMEVPVEFLQMLPYIAAVLTLLLPIGKARVPAAIGKPYFKE